MTESHLMFDTATSSGVEDAFVLPRRSSQRESGAIGAFFHNAGTISRVPACAPQRILNPDLIGADL
jgi:hypothetical protein